MWKKKLERIKQRHKNMRQHILSWLRSPPPICSYFEIMQIAADVIENLQAKVKRLESREKQRKR